MGKKKKKPLKRKKKNTGRNQAKYRDLKMKVRDRFGKEEGDSKRIEFIDNPSQVKMSAVILKLAEPYLKAFLGNDNRVRTIISITVTVWNISFLSEEEQNELMEKMANETLPQEGDAQDIAQMLLMLDDLKKRKEKLFPKIRLAILGHNVRIDRDNIHLDVSSAPFKQEA